MPAQLVAGLHQTRQSLLQANAYTFPSSIDLFQKRLYQGLPPHKLAHKITKTLKSHLTRQLLADTRAFLRLRLSQVPWLFSSSSQLFDCLHVTPLKAIPSFSRLAILRWAIDFEPDLHFRLRPHLSRSTPCRCSCRRSSSIYPFGILQGAYHASHLTYDLLYTLNLPLDPDEPSQAWLLNGALRFLVRLILHNGGNVIELSLTFFLHLSDNGAHCLVSFMVMATTLSNIGSSFVRCPQALVVCYFNVLGRLSFGSHLPLPPLLLGLSLEVYGWPHGNMFTKDPASPLPLLPPASNCWAHLKIAECCW